MSNTTTREMCIAGDAHGNAYLMVFHATAAGIFKYNEEKLKKLEGHYLKNEVEPFNTLVDSLEIEQDQTKRAKLVWLGDILADRGRNDAMTLHLIDKLDKAGVDFDIILSNHDAVFLRACEADETFEDRSTRIAKVYKSDYPESKAPYGIPEFIMQQCQSGIQARNYYNECAEGEKGEKGEKGLIKPLMKSGYFNHVKPWEVYTKPNGTKMLVTHAPLTPAHWPKEDRKRIQQGRSPENMPHMSSPQDGKASDPQFEDCISHLKLQDRDRALNSRRTGGGVCFPSESSANAHALEVLQQGKYSEYYHGHDGSVYTTNFNGLRIVGLNGSIGRSDAEIGLYNDYKHTRWNVKLSPVDGLFSRYYNAILFSHNVDKVLPPFCATKYVDAEAMHDQESSAGGNTKTGNRYYEPDRFYTAKTSIEGSSEEGESLIQRQTTAPQATETCTFRHFLPKFVCGGSHDYDQ